MLLRRALVVMPTCVVLALAGAAWGVEEFVLVALSGVGMLGVGGLALGWQVRRSRRGLVLEIDRVGGEVFVGDDATVSLVRVNRHRRAAPGLWLRGAGRWQVAFPGLGAATSPGLSAVAAASVGGDPGRPGDWTPLPALGPGERCRVPIAVPTSSRGLWTWGPAELWCTDPFGLMARRVAPAPVARVVVLPVPAALDAADLPAVDPAPGRSGSGDEGPAAWAGGGDEFAGLRPYVPGDRLTRLHWPALARNDQLVARHFVEHRDPLDLVIDTRPWKIEAAVAAAAGLGTAALATRRPLWLHTDVGEHLVVLPGRFARQRLLRALAFVAASRVGVAPGARSRGSPASTGDR